MDYDDGDDDDMPIEGSYPCNILDFVLQATPLTLISVRLEVILGKELLKAERRLVIALFRVNWGNLAKWLLSDRPNIRLVLAVDRKVLGFFRVHMSSMILRGRLRVVPL